MIKLFYITAGFFREILFASPTLMINVPERWKVSAGGAPTDIEGKRGGGV